MTDSPAGSHLISMHRMRIACESEFPELRPSANGIRNSPEAFGVARGMRLGLAEQKLLDPFRPGLWDQGVYPTASVIQGNPSLNGGGGSLWETLSGVRFVDSISTAALL